MGDWNTLHFFNDKYFYSNIASDFKERAVLLKQYFNSEFGKYALWNNDNSEERISKIIDFCNFLDKDFKSHKVLYEIATRKKKLNEQYSDFRDKVHKDEKRFYEINEQIIEDINHILPLIIFSECGSFNPHLILGRRIFTDCVSANPNSIAQDIISKVLGNENGSIYYSNMSNCSGIINWITNEELQLLWLDKDNITSTGEYFVEFKKMVVIALENNLGLISVTNVHETLLNSIELPKLKIEIEVKAQGFESIINYEEKIKQ